MERHYARVRRTGNPIGPFRVRLTLDGTRRRSRMAGIVTLIVILVIAALATVLRSIQVVQQYEEGILFRWGRVLPEVRSAGLHFIRPVGDRMQKVNKQI